MHTHARSPTCINTIKKRWSFVESRAQDASGIASLRENGFLTFQPGRPKPIPVQTV